ncbi:NAD(P)-dependent alcohol dehydrogenase [Sinimarinibacterium thermocellulolyticum]|uniref:NAD(P)-dependent alcohol dehydrogenase n=1 Tax=Sinimarinibacterium thermocellulolyticum TaxID=3170016 RepID=A0ABV2AEJ4_9GAMM
MNPQSVIEPNRQRILAAVARGEAAPFAIESLELDAPRRDEVLVRIVGVGLCHTDLVGAAGELPIALPAVFGHEGAGIVEAVGAGVPDFSRGDAVVISFRSCGRCRRCGTHEPAYCLEGAGLNYAGRRPDGSATHFDADGPIAASFFGQSSFATHSLAYADNLVRLPPEMPVEIAGPLGCSVQTGVGAVLRSLDCRPGSALLVLGGGAVGLSSVIGAAHRGCSRICVVEPHAARRELALELGATEVADPSSDPSLKSLRKGGGFDYAIDTTGRPDVLNAAARLLDSRGSFGFLAIPSPEHSAAPLPANLSQLMYRGLNFRGILEGDSEPQQFIPELCRLYAEGRLPFDRMIRRYSLAQINEAIADQAQGRCVKAVLNP